MDDNWEMYGAVQNMWKLTYLLTNANEIIKKTLTAAMGLTCICGFDMHTFLMLITHITGFGKG